MLLLSSPGPCLSSEASKDPASEGGSGALPGSFYERCKEGWYWFKEEKKAEQAREPAGQKEQQVQTAGVPPRLLEAYTYEQLWGMHPEELRKLLTAYLEKAVQDPSEANVVDYVVLQDLARRKALAFAGSFAYVVQKYPELSANLATYSHVVPAIKTRLEMTQAEVSVHLASVRDSYGLIVVSSRSCAYCDVQRSIMQHFTAQYGWPVKEVFIEDPEGERAARAFGVTVTPTVILVSRAAGRWMPVAVGVVSASALAERLYRAVRILEGRDRPEQYLLWDFEKGTPADPLAFPDLERIVREAYSAEVEG